MNGELQIVMMSNENAPEPWIYDATFSWTGGGGAMKPRRLTGDDELRALLQDLGVTDIDGFVGHAREGRVVVRNLWLTDHAALYRWELL
jgi:hypothetical protein